MSIMLSFVQVVVAYHSDVICCPNYVDINCCVKEMNFLFKFCMDKKCIRPIRLDIK